MIPLASRATTIPHGHVSTWRPISPPPFWQRWLPEWLHGPVHWLLWTGLWAGGAMVCLTTFYALLAWRFDPAEVEQLPVGTAFYDRHGREIQAPGSTGRKLATRDDLPDFLVQALLAREDARFFQHPGVDLPGLARAFLRNVKDLKFTQGASTLTMQLARNTFHIKQKSLHRKFLEIALTLRIEARFSKDEILTHYLNRIYFGAGAYGIEQAARTYFGKSTSQLTPAESATVVGIIRGPHLFSPFRNPQAALEQRRQTLQRMVAGGFIDQAAAERHAADPLKLAEDGSRENQTSYALQAAGRELERILADSQIELDGLKVFTTLDAPWQQRLEHELNRAVESLEQEPGWNHPTLAQHPPGAVPNYVQFSAITVEVRTGQVLALIGGRDFSHSRYDRTRANRDLGSAFEPFVAAAAAERGKLVLAGRPVQTGRQIGPDEVERLARRCGFDGPFVTSEDLFRGAVAATPLEMATGLATLGNRGKRPKPFLIREVRDAHGEVIHRADPLLTQALSPAAAIDATSVLRRSGGTRCFTGATASERDAWTLRLGPGGATAIWIGFDQPTPITREPRLKSLLDEFVKRLGNDR